MIISEETKDVLQEMEELGFRFNAGKVRQVSAEKNSYYYSQGQFIARKVECKLWEGFFTLGVAYVNDIADLLLETVDLCAIQPYENPVTVGNYDGYHIRIEYDDYTCIGVVRCYYEEQFILITSPNGRNKKLFSVWQEGATYSWD